MPLLDHFHPPLELRYPWDSFHSSWATRLADALNERLPPGYIAAERTHAGSHLEIDVATLEWAPPAAPFTLPAVFPDNFEVRVFATTGGLTLVGAIELISPGNKDRDDKRRAFAMKCASYLHQGVSAIVIDIVTSRRANLHNELMHLLEAPGQYLLGNDVDLYGVAYRPVRRQERAEIDFWPEVCAVGKPLPLLPLRLTGDLFVPVDFEAAYHETCRRRRLV